METEICRLKSALSAERKLRSLQLEAIRSLWGQVQKISSSDSTQSIMTQSMPNGLSNSPPKKEALKSSAMSMSFTGGTLGTLNERQESNSNSNAVNASGDCAGNCGAKEEIQLLRQSLTTEISQLRDMISKLTTKDGDSNCGDERPVKNNPGSFSVTGEKSSSDAETSVISISSVSVESDDKEKDRDHHPQRPLSLNIIGMSQGQTDQSQQPEKKEISGYANQMASKLLEDAVENEEKDNCDIEVQKKYIGGESHF